MSRTKLICIASPFSDTGKFSFEEAATGAGWLQSLKESNRVPWTGPDGVVKMVPKPETEGSSRLDSIFLAHLSLPSDFPPSFDFLQSTESDPSSTELDDPFTLRDCGTSSASPSSS